jgi:error-prone DNA polymerase
MQYSFTAAHHGVISHPPDINASLTHATLEPDPASTGGVTICLGLAGVRALGDDTAAAIVPMSRSGRAVSRHRRPLAPHPPRHTRDRSPRHHRAFTSVGADGREALWAAGVAEQTRAELATSRIP